MVFKLKVVFILFKIRSVLTLIFPMIAFDSPENIRKPKDFLMFSVKSKGNIRKTRVKKLWKMRGVDKTTQTEIKG